MTACVSQFSAYSVLIRQVDMLTLKNAMASAVELETTVDGLLKTAKAWRYLYRKLWTHNLKNEGDLKILYQKNPFGGPCDPNVGVISDSGSESSYVPTEELFSDSDSDNFSVSKKKMLSDSDPNSSTALK